MESELFDQPGDRINCQYGGTDPVSDHGLQPPDDIYLYADYILKVVDSLWQYKRTQSGSLFESDFLFNMNCYKSKTDSITESEMAPIVWMMIYNIHPQQIIHIKPN